MIKVLIVDDSPSIAEFLSALFTADPEFVVLGIARNGTDAIRLTENLRPDIISMDITMPGIDGFDTTRQIMSRCPTPIVIVSSLYNPALVGLSFKALQAGALAITALPGPITSPDFHAIRDDMLRTFKAMAGVRVVRRTFTLPVTASAYSVAPLRTHGEVEIIALGASTGGPPVLQTILSALPKSITAPIVIVQHITQGFAAGLAAWLGQTTGFPVRLAEPHELPLPGHVYIAPEGAHLEVTSGGRLVQTSGLPEHGVCPSVSRFFRSVAKVHGRNAIGVLLTGMGRDGAAELRLMRDAGAATIAQDQESSVVHGMPGEAIRLGGAGHVLPAESIAAMIATLTRRTGV